MRKIMKVLLSYDMNEKSLTKAFKIHIFYVSTTITR